MAPGLVENKLLVRSVMHIPSPIHPYDLPTELLVQNPLSATMSLVKSDCEIYVCEEMENNNCAKFYTESTGKYTPDKLGEAVPGKGQTMLKRHTVKLYKLLSPEMLKTMFYSVGHGSRINLSGSMTILVGTTEMVIDYAQADVPICLDYLGHSCDKLMLQ